MSRETTVDGVQLGVWLNNQRAAHRRGDLSPERAARLETLPGWAWDPLEDDWELGFALLKHYVAEHGDSPIPARLLVGSFRLGQWVGVQRTRWKSGKLAAARVARLEAVPGWSWDPFNDDWRRAFALLQAYVAEHGDALVPHDYVVDGVRLGQWVGTQRGSRRRGTLTADRIAQLQGLPGWVWAAPKDPRGHARVSKRVSRDAID